MSIPSEQPHGLAAQAVRLATERSGLLGRPRPVMALLAAYLAAAGGTAGIALALGRNPLACPGWLGIDPMGAPATLLSLGAGVCVAALTIAATRVMVHRAAWARALHEALRPAVSGAGDGWLLAVALASALGEELLFRGLLVPVAGVILPSLVFGALHQVRGPARWGWMAWATAMGVLFSVVFAATGSLAGPVAAHLAINAANLRYLRDTAPARPRKPLGGLLRRA